ncbi:putative ATP-dependent RNA helicase Mrh4 [Delphinella strobiligena]|nr:putative ATP-dependent RNA helicase Mrh4 [Delphinella strobiligena]
MATAQKQRPSRMELSPKVRQRSPEMAPSGKPVRRNTNSPFGAMNQTNANIRGQSFNKISAAEQKRASRFKPSQKDSNKNERDPFHALKMQRALSPVSYGQRSSVKQSIADLDTFDQLDLLPVIKDSVHSQALQGLAEISPTPIQRLAIPALLGTDGKKRRSKSAVEGSSVMQQFLLAAETGSGKTLAYLLPIIDAIKRQEVIDAESDAEDNARKEAEKRRVGNLFELEAPPLSNDPHPTTGRPRAIILLPTAELVSQVGAVAKLLSHTVKFRSALVSSAYTGQVIRSRLFSPSGIDILISTPHLLASISESDPNVLSRVTHLVIDEADSLLDRSFAPITGSILDRATPSLKQLVLCSATIPRSLDSYLRKRYPDVRRLATPNLHAIPRRVQLSVVDVEKDPYKGNRNLACADTIWNLGREIAESGEEARETTKRVIVFVNEREKTVELADYLKTKGVDAIALNRDTGDRKQTEVLHDFTGLHTPEHKPTKLEALPGEINEPSAKSSRPKTVPATTGHRQLANVKVLVMTDLGSRGIDTLMVKNVILYDIPHTSIDFIHRLGRVGRMGRRGRGVVLVGKGDRRDVVKEVREGMFKGQALI